MNKYTFSLILVILAILAGLGYLANEGSVTALIVFTVVVTCVLIGLGSLLTWSAINLMTRQQERQFRDNVSENIGIMREMQSLQNQQNKTLMTQLGTVARLPQAAPPLDLSKSLLIDDGIFTELDQ